MIKFDKIFVKLHFNALIKFLNDNENQSTDIYLQFHFIDKLAANERINIFMANVQCARAYRIEEKTKK